MKTGALLTALAAIGSVAATPTVKEPPTKRSSLPTVTVSGNAFWAGSERFYLRGIDYQPGGSSANKDPLVDTAGCKRDIAKFKDLGVNTIRVYAVDNSKSHDECMAELEAAGIYLVLDVNNPAFSLNRINPKPSYNAKYLQSIFATVEMFAKYKNTLAFFSGNEVINDQKGTDASAPYIKAVTRDMKNYMNSRGLRQVPVGYSAADVSSNRMQTAQYMNCGSDDMRSDFFAFNDYSWCNSNFQTSGWDQKVKNFTDYGLPIFLSEYGCNINRPRKFEEVSALMSTSDMTAVYSGGLMYEYSQESNNYGIVKISGDKVTETTEYTNFKNELKKNPSPTGSGGASKTTHAVSCPKKDKTNWNVDPSEVPAMPNQAETYMKSGAGKGPGLLAQSKGSQNAANSGTSTKMVTGGKPSPTSASSSSDSSSSSSGNKNSAASSQSASGALGMTVVVMVFTVFGALAL